MTTTDTLDSADMTSPAPTRRLRRSRTDRIGAGVAGGLGEYFRIDPVIFRVLFATAAFFGGAGVLAYLLAWAAIPEEGTERAAIDGWVTSLRNRRVPVWVLAAAAGVLLWLIAFSWWAPGPFFPVLAVVLILVVVFGRRGRAAQPPAPATVRLEKDTVTDEPTARPRWAGEARQWISESRTARRERARRAFPVKVATLLALVVALLTLALIDSVNGIRLPVYFWFSLAILSTGLIVGMVLRRTPRSVGVLLIPTVAGLVAFAGTHASLHDGVGQREWTPTSAPSAQYKLAFGQATLDLRSLRTQDVPRTIDVEQAAGQLHIIAPKSLNLTVHAHVHFGVVTLDGESPHDGAHGVSVVRDIEPLATATGQPITIDLHLADGRVDIDRR
jgi:phage shock protein PspC (stress-responsive transcriptional regulator)/predicted membrane protein